MTSHRKESLVVGAWGNGVCIRRLCRTFKEQCDRSEYYAFTHTLSLECFRHGREGAEEFRRVLTRERFQGWLDQIELPLQLMQRKIGIVANVRLTVSDAIAATVFHRTKSVNVRHQLVESGKQAIIRSTRGQVKWDKLINLKDRRIVAGITRYFI